MARKASLQVAMAEARQPQAAMVQHLLQAATGPLHLPADMAPHLHRAATVLRRHQAVMALLLHGPEATALRRHRVAMALLLHGPAAMVLRRQDQAVMVHHHLQAVMARHLQQAVTAHLQDDKSI